MAGVTIRLRQAAIALAALATTACAHREPDAQTVNVAPAMPEAVQARPALWKVADEDTTLYLFGTIHVLPPGVDWRSDKLEAAIDKADELVLEVANSNDMAAAGAMMQLGLSPDLPKLADRVPEDKRAALEKMVEESGMPKLFIDRLETWAAGLALMGVSFKRLGLDPTLGVETVLTKEFEERNRPISGLETVAQQLGFFDTLSEEAQRVFLLSVIDDGEEARKTFADMLEAWRKGDSEAIARNFDDETQLSPELREAVIRRRNAAWAEWVQKRLDKPGAVLIAVGAGHLAGADSVQAMLAAKGIKAERVQ
jgi:uncharacterized protein YbaP (TraB family)